MRSITYAHTTNKDPQWIPEWRSDPAIKIVKETTADLPGLDRSLGLPVSVSTAYVEDDDVLYITLKYPDVTFDSLLYG